MGKKLSIIGFAAISALALACGGTGASDETEAIGNQAADDKKADAKAAAKIGDAVRDGKFEFTAQKVKCGVAKVGDDLLGATAQGQFCLVTVKVKNIGKKAQMFSDSAQKAYGADGVEYATDSSAGFYANKNADTLLNEINPGNEITGVIVFDIPKKAKLTKLKLHDSVFSGGATVTLG